MSRLYEALRKSELENQQKNGAILTEVSKSAPPVLENPVETIAVAPMELTGAKNVQTRVTPNAHLVALTEPHGLPAEKFRVLMTRLNNLRSQSELKSLQVTSGVVDEGKTLISANLAITLARHSQHRVLLVEGDLHNPALHGLLGLSHLKGLRQWWDDPKSLISDYLYQINDLPLWYLPAGGRFDEPGMVLQSGRFAEAFAQVSGPFDWVVVDSTPLLPMADANIWNRLVDGALLVVREGVTPVNALKKGIEALDDPKLIGVVLNGASEFDRVNYYDQYYAQTGTNKTRKNGKPAEVRG